MGRSTLSTIRTAGARPSPARRRERRSTCRRREAFAERGRDGGGRQRATAERAATGPHHARRIRDEEAWYHRRVGGGHGGRDSHIAGHGDGARAAHRRAMQRGTPDRRRRRRACWGLLARGVHPRGELAAVVDQDICGGGSLGGVEAEHVQRAVRAVKRDAAVLGDHVGRGAERARPHPTLRSGLELAAAHRALDEVDEHARILIQGIEAALSASTAFCTCSVVLRREVVRQPALIAERSDHRRR